MFAGKQARKDHGSTGPLIVLVLSSALCGCQPKVAELPADRRGPSPESPTAQAPTADFISPELPAPPSTPSVPEHIKPTPAPPGPQRTSSVWVFEVESGRKQFVSHGCWPLWSPDGSLLGFNQSEADARTLGVSVWDGKDVKLVAADTAPTVTRFVWTSDSREIVVESLYVTTPQGRRQGPRLVPISVADGRQGQPLGPGGILSGWPRQGPRKGMCLGPRGQRHVWTPGDPEYRTLIGSWIEAARDITARAKIDRGDARSLIGELAAAAHEYEAGNDEAATKHVALFLRALERHRHSGTLTAEQTSALGNAGNWNPQPAPIGWAGDGRVVFAAGRPGKPPTWAPTKVLMVDPVGGGEPVVMCEVAGDLVGIDWSPDLSRLAIVLEERGQREDEEGRPTGALAIWRRLKIIDLASRTETDVGPGQTPHWSPDGKYLLYVEWKVQPLMESPWGNLYLVDAQGQNRQAIAQVHVVGAPQLYAWSPDSRLVAYQVAARLDDFRTRAEDDTRAQATAPPTPKPATRTTRPAPQRPTGVPPTLATFKGRGSATTGEFGAEAHWTVMWKRPSSNGEEPIRIRWVRQGGGPKAEGEIVTVQRIPMGDMTGGRSRVVSETGRFCLKVETTGEWEIIVREVQ